MSVILNVLLAYFDIILLQRVLACSYLRQFRHRGLILLNNLLVPFVHVLRRVDSKMLFLESSTSWNQRSPWLYLLVSYVLRDTIPVVTHHENLSLCLDVHVTFEAGLRLRQPFANFTLIFSFDSYVGWAESSVADDISLCQFFELLLLCDPCCCKVVWVSFRVLYMGRFLCNLTASFADHVLRDKGSLTASISQNHYVILPHTWSRSWD